MLARLVLGLILSACIGLVGYWRASLSRSGVLGAVITGTIIFGLGGVLPGLLLIAFFASSSALSHYRARAKENLADKFQKGSRRDLGQALANGGWAALLILLFVLLSVPFLLAAFFGALAAVTADTWATEVGVLNPRPPRLITTGQSVPIGTSGGITLLGTAVSLVGGLFIGAVAFVVSLLLSVLAPGWLAPIPPAFVAFRPSLVLLVAAGVGGLLGSLFDSLLGATCQAIYYCPTCQRETERRVHTCGTATRRVRGLAWLDNDAVNFLASVAGSIVAALCWLVLWGA